MVTLNDLIRQQGERIYFTPLSGWLGIYQPDPKDAITNPPFNTANL